jgi:hypothetical protein
MTKILSCVAVVGLLVASSSSVFAKGPQGGGASAVSPGQQFRSGATAPVQGLPGASGYSPGQRANGGPTPNGASVYAPGFLK